MAWAGLPTSNREFADPSINFHLAPGDELVQCPYYPHKILRSRLSTHLSKCMNQYKKDLGRNPRLPKYVICKFNWQHHVKGHELADHLENGCEDARKARKRDEQSDFVNFVTVKDEVSGVSVSYADTSEEVSVEVVPETDTTESMVSGGFESSIFSTGAEALPVLNISPSPDLKKVKTERRVPTRDLPAGKQEDDWEMGSCEDGAAVSYFDQRKVLESRHIYFIPPGMTKTERTAYRERMAGRYSRKEVDEDDEETKAAKAAEDAAWDRQIADAKRQEEAEAAAALRPRPPKTRKEEALDDQKSTKGSICFSPFGHDHDFESDPNGSQ